jgi:hypothetical protein
MGYANRVGVETESVARLPEHEKPAVTRRLGNVEDDPVFEDELRGKMHGEFRQPTRFAIQEEQPAGTELAHTVV